MKNKQSRSLNAAVNGFIILVINGWDVELAFTCMYDTVFDLIGIDSFITLCQKQCEIEKVNLLKIFN